MVEVVDVDAVVEVVELVVEVLLVDVDVLEELVDEDDVVEEVDDVELVEPPPVTVTMLKGSAATGLVPVQAASGTAPHPAGVGTPGVQEKVTAMNPPGPTRAVVELSPRLRATSPPAAVQVDVGNVADTDKGAADSSPEFFTAGVGSVIVVVPVTETGGNVWVASVVFAPSNSTTTSAGMEFAPTDNSPSRYPARSTSPGTPMLNVPPDKVIVSPVAAVLGVAEPLTAMGSAVVPACAVFVHDVGVVTVPAWAGGAPASEMARMLTHTGSTARAAKSRLRRSSTELSPLWLGLTPGQTWRSSARVTAFGGGVKGRDGFNKRVEAQTSPP